VFIDTVDGWASRRPNRVAHQYRDWATTYEALRVHSDALCLWLREQEHLHRIEGQRPVIVWGHKEPGMLIAFLACAKAGRPYIPVDVSSPPGRLQQIIVSSGAGILVSPARVLDPGPGASLPCLGDLSGDSPCYAPYLGQIPPPGWRIKDDDICYVIYTSGSTGVPKGVQITLRALESFLNWVTGLFRPREGAETFLNQAPFSFDLSVMDLYLSLVSGGTLWSIDREHATNPAELFRSLARSRITFWVSTPSFAEMCLADPAFDATLLPELRCFLFCGEVLTNDTAARLKSRFPSARVENMYGPTETTVAVTSLTVTNELVAAAKPLPVGRAKPDCRILICRPQELTDLIERHSGRLPAPLRPLRDGERGEIVIAGPSVSAGYLNNPVQTEKAFFTWEEDGRLWRAYRTGDCGYYEGGLLFYQGRLDSQLKLHGYRIEPGEIEENLRRVAWVDNAVVLGVEKDGRIAYLKAFIVTSKPPHDPFEARRRLRESLQERLPAYMLPRSFVFIDRLPMTPNGKVDRRRLLEEYR